MQEKELAVADRKRPTRRGDGDGEDANNRNDRSKAAADEDGDGDATASQDSDFIQGPSSLVLSHIVGVRKRLWRLHMALG